MNRQRLRHAQAVLGVAILVLGLAVSPATAADEPKQEQPGTAPEEAPPGGFASWDELSKAQDRLNAAADQLLSEPSEGFSGLVAAPESHELVVYWKGEVPADALNRAKNTEVPVRFVPARYSQVELAAEIERLSKDNRVYTAVPEVDGSGVTVTVGSNADRDAVLAEARLALTATVDEQAPKLLYNRQNDISPYWGGARWDNLSSGSYCSTGFSVLWRNQRKMLTAGHCGANGNVARVGNAGQPNTTITLDANWRDTQMLNAPSGRSFAGRIYAGGIYSASSLKVIGSAADYVGNWICTSGARTGRHCGIRVRAVNTSVLGIAPLTYAAKSRGNCVAAPGDSGGPVFSYGLHFSHPWPYIQFGARARGTITAGYMDTWCQADSGSRQPPAIWTVGSYRVFYAPTQRPFWDPYIGSLRFYNASLL